MILPKFYKPIPQRILKFGTNVTTEQTTLPDDNVKDRVIGILERIVGVSTMTSSWKAKEDPSVEYPDFITRQLKLKIPVFFKNSGEELQKAIKTGAEDTSRLIDEDFKSRVQDALDSPDVFEIYAQYVLLSFDMHNEDKESIREYFNGTKDLSMKLFWKVGDDLRKYEDVINSVTKIIRQKENAESMSLGIEVVNSYINLMDKGGVIYETIDTLSRSARDLMAPPIAKMNFIDITGREDASFWTNVTTGGYTRKAVNDYKKIQKKKAAESKKAADNAKRAYDAAVEKNSETPSDDTSRLEQKKKDAAIKAEVDQKAILGQLTGSPDIVTALTDRICFNDYYAISPRMDQALASISLNVKDLRGIDSSVKVLQEFLQKNSATDPTLTGYSEEFNTLNRDLDALEERTKGALKAFTVYRSGPPWENLKKFAENMIDLAQAMVSTWNVVDPNRSVCARPDAANPEAAAERLAWLMAKIPEAYRDREECMRLVEEIREGLV